MQALIRRATKEDFGQVSDFLSRAGLGLGGLTEETIEYFLLLEDDKGTLKGSLGMEILEDYGLLRSLVVSPGQAEKDIMMLFNQMLQLAKEKGVNGLYLATNKSITLPFFELLGFKRCGQEELPVSVSQSEHIRHILNVDNSIFLEFLL